MNKKEKWCSLEFIASYYNYVNAISYFAGNDKDIIVEIYEDKNKNEIGKIVESFTIDKVYFDSVDGFTILEEFYYYNDGYYSVRIYQD